MTETKPSTFSRSFTSSRKGGVLRGDDLELCRRVMKLADASDDLVC